MNIKPARHLVAWLLRRQGFAGITLPWAVYLLPERFNDAALRRHEQVHVEQMASMGALRFYAVYLWQWARYGYAAMPLEQQARAAEGGVSQFPSGITRR